MFRMAFSFLLAVLAVSSLAAAFDDNFGLDKRQSTNTTERQSTTFSATPSRTSSVVVTSSTVIISPTSTSVTVTSITSTLTSSASSIASSSASSASSESVTTTFSTIVTSSSVQVVQTITSTNSGGSIVTATKTTNTVVPVTATSAIATVLGESSNGGGPQGLSETSKQVIGGVVGGVGGALLLGALGFTAWRIWGKKKNYHDDDLYDPNSQQEKLQSSTDGKANTPFQSTLDQYHRPGPVNTAANF